MSLKAQLDEITARTRSLVQPDRLAVVDQGVRDLVTSRESSHVLAIGSPAPDFSLIDSKTSRPVHARDLLALGPVVLVFFRGRWCPYDMAELEAWQPILPAIRSRGALLAAVSPQQPRQNDFAASQHGLTFPLLSDPGCKLASHFGVAYTVSEALQRHYRSILVNLPFLNGDATWQLPLPATFVLSPNGTGAPATITYADTHADHRSRTEPSTDCLLSVPRDCGSTTR